MAFNSNFATTIKLAVDSLTAADMANVSTMIHAKSFVRSDLASVNKVITGVRNGSVLPILNNKPNPASFPFKDATNCDATDCDVSHSYSTHTWELGLVECRLGICMKSFDEDFLTFYNAYKATAAGGQDIDMDSLLLKYITDQFIDNLILASWRASYFGDKASADPFLNKIDGIFVQLEAGAGDKIDITQNAGADYNAQMALTGEETLQYLTTMYNKAAEKPWFNIDTMVFEITRSMGSRLVAFLNKADATKSGCSCIDPRTMVASPFFTIEGLRLFGVKIVVIGEWDDIINYLPSLNGGGGNNARTAPHRAILTSHENLLIGTTANNTLNTFEMWYSKDAKKIYVEGSSYLGGGVPMDEYVIAI